MIENIGTGNTEGCGPAMVVSQETVNKPTAFPSELVA